MTNDLLNISLNQGKQFTKYQTKITKNIDIKEKILKGKIIEGFVSSEQENMIRPSDEGYVSVINNQENIERLSQNKKENKKEIDELNQLQSKYDDLMQQYTTIQEKISNDSLDTINRLSKNNPYLGKNIRFTNGAICYVTNQGIAKPFTSQNIYNNTIGKNGCPKEFIQLNISWSNTFVAGSIIPTNPKLIVGSKMVESESCGSEGKNIYASTLIKNPTSEYIGCYNDTSAPSETILVPVMSKTCEVNGFKASASSIYQNNNDFAGPWCAFDNNINTWWHSGVTSPNIYDGKTGKYIGSNKMNFTDLNGSNVNIAGEYLQITLPNNTPIKVTKYSIQGRQGCCGQPNGRDPNTWYILGYNNGQWYQVDYQKNISFKWKSLTFNITNPQEYSSYLILISVVGDNDAKNTRNCVQIATWELISSGSNPDDITSMSLATATATTIDKCREYAADNGYQYFGMRNYNSDGTADCLVSNDITKIQMYGDATSKTTIIPIWASNTVKTEASIAKLGGRGRFVLMDMSNKLIWQNTESDPVNCAINYSFSDNTNASRNDLAHYTNTTLDDCQASCTENNKCYGIAMNTSSNNECWLKSNFKKIKDDNNRALYKKEKNAKENCKFMLILQDDGNMCIYQGTPDNIIQPSVWNSKTNGKQLQPNSEWEASKNAYGRNYIIGGETLSVNQWISSNNGSLKLIMQRDGNLVLYTSQIKMGCKIVNNNTYGAPLVNAVYKLNSVGNPATFGKIGYVDGETKLKEYPDSMLSYTNSYKIYEETDSLGNDITSLIVNDESDCQSSCTNTKDCAAYVYQGFSKTCWLKNNAAYPNGSKQTNPEVNLGIRKKNIISTTNCNTEIIEVDTIQYDNYIKGTDMTSKTSCNSPVVSHEDIIKLDNIKSQLTNLGQDIASKMETLYNTDNDIYEKLKTNEIQFNKDLQNYKNINTKIKKELELQSNNNIEGMQNYVSSSDFTSLLNFNDISGMLSDTSLRVIQENYLYLLWSVLALCILLITITMMNRK